MNKIIIPLLILLALGSGVFFVLSSNSKKQEEASPVSVTPSEDIVGGDKDEHGCIPSAGYTWCDATQKCIRQWEEECSSFSPTPTPDETDALKRDLRQALIEKHGPDAEELVLTVSKISGIYAQGSVTEQGVGGGLWFAAKTGGSWKLVWDGNGIITCETLTDYPDFPSDMIPECYNESADTITKR